MVAFDPKVALRILREKQRRLDDEAFAYLRQRFEHEMNGGWYDKRFYELDALYEAKSKEAGSMFHVIDYLEGRIEAEKSREERIWDMMESWGYKDGVAMIEDVFLAADMVDRKGKF